MSISSEQREIVLALVADACAHDPKMLRPIVDAATAGVKKYADDQNDRASALAARLISVMDTIPEGAGDKFGNFTAAEALEALEGYFGGTEGLARLRDKFGVPQPEVKTEEVKS
jgi:hypothetical protein